MIFLHIMNSINDYPLSVQFALSECQSWNLGETKGQSLAVIVADETVKPSVTMPEKLQIEDKTAIVTHKMP